MFLFFFFFLQNTSSFALLWDCVDEGKFERTIAGAEQEPGFRSPSPPWANVHVCASLPHSFLVSGPILLNTFS